MACPIVDCSKPECAQKCGNIDWVGNMSECSVTLQYRLPRSAIWYNLSDFPPGSKTELGGGTVLLPGDAVLRVVETNNPEHIILDLGRIGIGLPSIYIDSNMCKLSKVTSMPSLPKSNSVNWILVAFWASIIFVIGVVIYRLRHKLISHN